MYDHQKNHTFSQPPFFCTLMGDNMFFSPFLDLKRGHRLYKFVTKNVGSNVPASPRLPRAIPFYLETVFHFSRPNLLAVRLNQDDVAYVKTKLPQTTTTVSYTHLTLPTIYSV